MADSASYANTIGLRLGRSNGVKYGSGLGKTSNYQTSNFSNGSEAVKKFTLSAENGLLSPTLSSTGGEGEARLGNFFTASQGRRGQSSLFSPTQARKKCRTD